MLGENNKDLDREVELVTNKILGKPQKIFSKRVLGGATGSTMRA